MTWVLESDVGLRYGKKRRGLVYLPLSAVARRALLAQYCVLSSRCLVCRPSHLGGCRVGTPPARKKNTLSCGEADASGRTVGPGATAHEHRTVLTGS